jgi:3'-phosphoadenosine 5'-phosphosulfate sulfotransferase (PAPS reductase)/FAD synthetase
MIKCVVPISGGKDSQACLKLALQKFEPSEIIGLFCDTQFEHPKTYAHIEYMRSLYGVRIDVVSDGDVLSLVRKYKRFPSDVARFCTDELKIKAGKRYYKALAELQKSGFEVWYGMRRSESRARAERYAGTICDEVYPPHLFMPSKYPMYLDKMGVAIRLPVVDWSDADIFEFLAGEQNPLYSLGFDRVGCFPCLASGDSSKERAFAFDAVGQARRIEVVQIGKEINKNVFRSKGGVLRNYDTMISKVTAGQDDLFDSPPCMICQI